MILGEGKLDHLLERLMLFLSTLNPQPWVSAADRLISILCLVEILIGAAFLILILLLALTWHPKMM